MPIYTFKCRECKEYKEEYLPLDRFDEKVTCECGGETDKVIPHIYMISKGSPHRDIDCIVGEDSEKKWEQIYKKKSEKDKAIAKKLKEKMKNGKTAAT